MVSARMELYGMSVVEGDLVSASVQPKQPTEQADGIADAPLAESIVEADVADDSFRVSFIRSSPPFAPLFSFFSSWLCVDRMIILDHTDRYKQR